MGQKMQAVFETKNLSKSFFGITVLSNVDFAIYPGEVHALVGENGAGKSTLIKIISGVEKPDTGSQLFHKGELVGRYSAAKSKSMGLSVIYQDISLFQNMTVAENICMVDSPNIFIDRKKMRERAKEVLNDLGVEIDVDELLGDISVGKQQLVAIVRAMLYQTSAIIMDEPTSALSSNEVAMLMNVITKIKEKNIGIVYISHKMEEIFSVADRITVLRDGNVVSTGLVSEYNKDKLISHMVGRELLFEPMLNQKGDSDKILFEIRELTHKPDFENISLSVHEHEVLGITGLVGAGRSELAQTIFGLKKSEHGDIFLNGKKLTIKSSTKAIELGIAYLAEDRRTQSMFGSHSMEKNITVASLKTILSSTKLISLRKERRVCNEYIDSLSIRPRNPLINIEHLSGGNQQKAIVARWLNVKPKLLIIDEPTFGVDVGAKVEIHRLVRNLADEGIAVILISSDLSEVLTLSDRILVMRGGKIVFETTKSDATQENIIEKALLG
jgi:ABC-type sugar transport system ATPase subunit